MILRWSPYLVALDQVMLYKKYLIQGNLIDLTFPIGLFFSYAYRMAIMVYLAAAQHNPEVCTRLRCSPWIHPSLTFGLKCLRSSCPPLRYVKLSCRVFLWFLHLFLGRGRKCDWEDSTLCVIIQFLVLDSYAKHWMFGSWDKNNMLEIISMVNCICGKRDGYGFRLI